MDFKVSRTSSWDQRDRPCDEAVHGDCGWFVSLGDMDEFIRFVDKYGQILVGRWCDSKNHRHLELEIYDDYRE